MAVDLIVYPTVSSNTFMTLTEANTKANNSIHYTYWAALTDDEKSRYMLHAFLVISKLNGIVFPETNEACLAQAQMDIVLNDLRYGFSESNATSLQEVKKDSAVTGTFTEYFESPSGSQLPNYIPASCWDCLSSYGATQPAGYCGIATLSKVREN